MKISGSGARGKGSVPAGARREGGSVETDVINAIEKGDYNPTIRLCIAICRELDKTLDEIFQEEEEC